MWYKKEKKFFLFKGMDRESVDKILQEIDFSVENPLFYSQLFSAVVKQQKRAIKEESLEQIFIEEYDESSQLFHHSDLQEGCSVRNVLKTRRLANLLINDEGKLDEALLPQLEEKLKTYLYSLGPERYYDAIRDEQILKVLQQLQKEKSLVLALKRISQPHLHTFADQIIRDTLGLPSNTVVTDTHTRRAALSAWMCMLRQNVGSCFATAPAIIVHDEQPERFLRDIQEFLSTGRMKRTFGGIEYAVPLSNSWGTGDLRKVIFSSQGLIKERREIWFSPGLLSAFETVGVIDKKLDFNQKVENIKTAVFESLEQLQREKVFRFCTVEDLIRIVLLKHHNLTEEDIEEY